MRSKSKQKTVYTLFVFFIILSATSFLSCTKKSGENESKGEANWLTGDDDQKFDMIANQLRGFDVAMAEVGYRYQEIYWAGKEENWELAAYHLEKTETAIKNGLTRRPKRKNSAISFLEISIPAMKETISKKDTVLFKKNFEIFRQSCNSCHISEKVPFFTVQIPTERNSPIRKNDK